MTNRERELASLGFEHAEGIEYAEVIIIPGTGREIRKGINEHGNVMWEVQPWNDNYWLHFDDLLEAIKCGTRPAGRPQRNPPAVEVRKPFVVTKNAAIQG